MSNLQKVQPQTFPSETQVGDETSSETIQLELENYKGKLG